jgi:hypothetical protein
VRRRLTAGRFLRPVRRSTGLGYDPAMGELAVLFAEAALGGASLGVLGMLACYGIDRLLTGHQHAPVIPPDQGTDPAPLDPVVPVLPPWYRGRGSWPA